MVSHKYFHLKLLGHASKPPCWVCTTWVTSYSNQPVVTFLAYMSLLALPTSEILAWSLNSYQDFGKLEIAKS